MLFIEIGQVFVEIWEGQNWCLGRAYSQYVIF